MRGHQPLIAMRRRGLRPQAAWIDLVPSLTEHSATWHQWSTAPHIEVTDSESVRRLDLRCLVGMDVMVGGFDPHRVADMHCACVGSGARFVMSQVWGKARHDDIETLHRRVTMNGRDIDG